MVTVHQDLIDTQLESSIHPEPWYRCISCLYFSKSINCVFWSYQSTRFLLPPPRLKLRAARHEQEESPEDTCPAEDSRPGV